MEKWQCPAGAEVEGYTEQIPSKLLGLDHRRSPSGIVTIAGSRYAVNVPK